MASLRCDEGIVDSCRICARCHKGKAHEWSGVECNTTSDVEVEIHATKLVEDSIAHNVGSLDILRIVGIMRENVGIVIRNKRRRIVVRPELVLPVSMELSAALSRGIILSEIAVANCDLVHNLRY